MNIYTQIVLYTITNNQTNIYAYVHAYIYTYIQHVCMVCMYCCYISTLKKGATTGVWYTRCVEHDFVEVSGNERSLGICRRNSQYISGIIYIYIHVFVCVFVCVCVFMCVVGEGGRMIPGADWERRICTISTLRARATMSYTRRRTSATCLCLFVPDSRTTTR